MPQPTLILGPLPALEDALADAVSAARAADPLAPVTVLVGQSLLKRYLPRMLAGRGAPQINTRFLLADELVASLARDSSNKARMSRTAERLIARVASEVPGPYFTDSARSDGFVTAIVRLSRELERGGFEAPALHGLLESAGTPAPKAEHLAAIYAEQARLREEARLVGPSQMQRDVDASLFEGPLIVYGLWDPTATLRSLLKDLVAREIITVLLPAYDDAQSEYAPFRSWLAARGAIVRLVGDGERSSLAHRAFLPPAPGTPGEVTLISSPNTVRETWEAARACIAWAQQGIPFHEMAVVYRHREQHRALIDEVFREAGIPTYLHDGAPLAEHPLGRRLLALLDLIGDEGFTRQHVMEFVTETDLPADTREAYKPVRPAEWDADSREAGVVQGIDQWRSRLQRLAAHRRERARNENFEWLAQHANRSDTLLRFVEDLHVALAAKRERAPWQDHLTFLASLATRYAYGTTPILDLLQELNALTAVQPIVTFEVFAQTVREELQSRDSSRVLGEPTREFGRHGVAVMDASSLRHMRFQAVYLLGLSERSWPTPPRPDPLLLEHERSALNAVASAAEIPMRTTPDEEPLTFQLAIDAAQSYLVASYARSQAGRSGRQLPSYFFRSLAEAVAGRQLSMQEVEHGATVRRLAAGRLSVEPLDASLTTGEYERGLIQHGDSSRTADVIAVLGLGPGLVARRSRWNPELTAYDGVLDSSEARQAAADLQFGRSTPVSASRLELYARCPYQYFLRYVLRLQQLDEPEVIDSIDHLERGSLIHAVLERFLKRLGGDHPSDDARTKHTEILRTVMEEEAADREQRGVTGRPLAWAIEKRQILEDLLRWYDAEVRASADSALRPRGFEVRFGGPGYRFGDESGDEDPLSSDAPVAVDAEGLPILIQGRIDRLDVDQAATHFRVIDYKTGATRDKTAPDRGRALQLPLYLIAASQALGIPVYQGEAQYFYCTRRGDYYRSTFSGQDLERRRDDLARVLRTIVDGVDSGYFAPNPGKNAENCFFCDFKFVCNAGINRIMNRKQEDGPASSFIALQDIV